MILGQHVNCGGEVVYTATATRGVRRCSRCGADGSHGRPSPEIDVWLRGEARLFDRVRVRNSDGEHVGDTFEETDRFVAAQEAAGRVVCLCGGAEPGAWTAGVHHGVHRCARVVTRV